MYRWYENSAKYHVYLSDVAVHGLSQPQHLWETSFKNSRWFTRGWTLQELLAPSSLEFFSVEGHPLGEKDKLGELIHDITDVPTSALRGTPLINFTVDERSRWAARRRTKKLEDGAYCLSGIFGVFLPLMYGEGSNAFKRLREEIEKCSSSANFLAIASNNNAGPEIQGHTSSANSTQDIHRKVVSTQIPGAGLHGSPSVIQGHSDSGLGLRRELLQQDWSRSLARHLQRLDIHEYNEVSRTTAFKAFADGIRGLQDDKSNVTMRHWIQRLDPIFDSFRAFIDGVASISQANPLVACLVWGNLLIILKV